MKLVKTIHARESSLFVNTKGSRPKDCQKILLDMLKQSSCNRVNGTLSRTPTHPVTAATAHAYRDAVIFYIFLCVSHLFQTYLRVSTTHIPNNWFACTWFRLDAWDWKSDHWYQTSCRSYGDKPHSLRVGNTLFLYVFLCVWLKCDLHNLNLKDQS